MIEFYIISNYKLCFLISNYKLFESIEQVKSRYFESDNLGLEYANKYEYTCGFFNFIHIYTPTDG